MRYLSAIAGLMVVGSSLADEGWSRFRGVNGDGVVQGEGIPVTFDERDYAWNIELPGTGHSSPVVWDERLFLTCLEPDGSKRSAVAISLVDGKLLWKKDFNFTEHSLHRFNNYASTTPCVDKDRVYLSWETGDRREVVALSHDGKEMWKKDVGYFEENHGTGASPILVDGLLIVPNDHAGEGGSILALDPKNGDTKWTYKRAPSKTSFATPVVFRPDRGEAQLLVAGTPFGVTGLDIQTGKKLWESGEPFDQRTVASPVLIGDVVFVTSGQGGGGKKAFAAKIPSKKRTKPVEAEWVETRGLPYVPTPVVKDGLIYLWTDSGVVNCIDAKSGESLWRERASGPAYSSPIIIGDTVLGCSKQGEVVAIKTGKKFGVIGKSDVGEPLNATPVVADGKLILRTATRLIAVGGGGKRRL